jgi:hypothetical protein
MIACYLRRFGAGMGRASNWLYRGGPTSLYRNAYRIDKTPYPRKRKTKVKKIIPQVTPDPDKKLFIEDDTESIVPSLLSGIKTFLYSSGGNSKILFICRNNSAPAQAIIGMMMTKKHPIPRHTGCTFHGRSSVCLPYFLDE